MADTYKLGGLTVIQKADVSDPNHQINTVQSSQFNRQAGLGKVIGDLYIQEDSNGKFNLITPVDNEPDGVWKNLSNDTDASSMNSPFLPYWNGAKFVDSPLRYDSASDKLISTVTLQLPGGSLDISETSTLSDAGGTIVEINNVDLSERFLTGIETGAYCASTLVQTFLNTDIQFGGDDVTTLEIPIGGSFTVNFTNLFEARIIGHTFRMNQGKIRFHVDVINDDLETIRKVDGNTAMNDIDFADAIGPNNDVTMEYLDQFVRYKEQEVLIVTFYNVGDEPAIVRGGPLMGNPAPFVNYWRTSYYDVVQAFILPNAFQAVNTTDIDQLKAVYVSGVNTDIPSVYAEVSLADGTVDAQRPSVGVAVEDSLAGGRAVYSKRGIVRQTDTSAWAIGDILYLGTSGNLTNIRPTSDRFQVMGTVLVAHSTQGVIDLDVQPEVLIPFRAYTQADNQVSTGSTSFSTALTLVFTPHRTARYKVKLDTKWRNFEKDVLQEMRVRLDDGGGAVTQDDFESLQYTGGDQGDNRVRIPTDVPLVELDLIGGTEYTLTLQYRTRESGKTAYMYYRKFLVEEIV